MYKTRFVLLTRWGYLTHHWQMSTIDLLVAAAGAHIAQTGSRATKVGLRAFVRSTNTPRYAWTANFKSALMTAALTGSPQIGQPEQPLSASSPNGAKPTGLGALRARPHPRAPCPTDFA